MHHQIRTLSASHKCGDGLRVTLAQLCERDAIQRDSSTQICGGRCHAQLRVRCIGRDEQPGAFRRATYKRTGRAAHPLGAAWAVGGDEQRTERARSRGDVNALGQRVDAKPPAGSSI